MAAGPAKPGVTLGFTGPAAIIRDPLLFTIYY